MMNYFAKHAVRQFQKSPQTRAIEKKQMRARALYEAREVCPAAQEPKTTAKKAPAKKKKTFLETLEYRLQVTLKDIEKYRAAGKMLLLEYSEKNAEELTRKINAVKKIRGIA
jgi:hypothetical protein